MNIKFQLPANFSVLPEDQQSPLMAKQKLFDELQAFDKEHKGKHVVCELWQLGRKGKSFSLAMRELYRKKCTIEADHFVTTNWFSLESGKVYVLNEKETEKFQKDNAAWKEEMKEKDEIERETGEALKGALKSVKASNKKK